MSEFRKAKQLIERNKEDEALEKLRQSMRSAKLARKFAEDGGREAMIPFRKIDELMLSLMPVMR